MESLYIWQLIFNQEWFALIFSYIILIGLVLFLPLFRYNKFIFIFMLLIANIRFWLIFINLYLFTLPGSGKDTLRFTRNAFEIANGDIQIDSLVGADLYEYFLSLIIKYFSSNALYLHLASNIIFILSIYILISLLINLKIKSKITTMIIFIINLFPSVLMNTVTTLREPYQIFFLLLAVYAIYKFIINKKLKYLTLFFPSLILFGMLHNGLVILIPLIILIFSLSFIWIHKVTLTSLFFLIITFIFFISTLILIGTGIISSQASEAIMSGDSLEYAENYRLSSPDTRASYHGEFDTSNIFTIVITGTSLFFKYMLFPFPWMISSIIDLISISENTFRILLIIYIFKNWTNSRIIIVFFIIYMLIELVWSLGTSNWGTASRHHIISLPILLIVYAYISNFKQKLNS